MRSRMILTLAAIAAFTSTASHATTIFSDDFDTTGGTLLNWDGGVNWDVEAGTVDLVASGDYSIDCLDGAGHCVDLDGSTGSAGRMLSRNLGPLDAGDYKFTYWLSGNQRSDASMDFAIVLSLGDGSALSIATHTLFGDDGWSQYTQRFSLADLTDPVNLAFDHFGGDNVGIVLDSVELRRVPEPGTLALLGLGLIAFGRVRRRI